MLLYWIWLSLRYALNEMERLTVLEHFDSPEDLYYADDARLSLLEDLSPKAKEALLDKSLEEAEGILAACAQKRIHILPFGDPRYPSALRSIPDPPTVLYYRGKLPKYDLAPLIGVVGTRKASAYGLDAAGLMGRELAGHGAVVVSGMAAGIDAAATQGALTAGQYAVGVLGCGVDVIYPRSCRALFQKMEQLGCLISEYPPGTPPNSWHFPRRNRIISGMSQGILVVEAPEKSGALITAQRALDQGRDVYVVPGNLGVATCQGSNALLRSGAMAVTCGWDILSEYAQQYPAGLHEKRLPLPQPDKKDIDKDAPVAYSGVEQPADDLDETEKAILSALGDREQLIDSVIAGIDLPSGDVLAALTLLEVKGYVITRPGGWARASKIH